MATKYDVIRRPGVQLVQKDPMSGWEALASALGDYYSPEEIRARKADRRADARVELEQDRFDELQEQNDFNQEQTLVANRRQAALDKRQTTVFNQGQEDRDYNQKKEDYDTALNPFIETGDLAGALEFLDTFKTDNPRLSAIAKQREKGLSRKNTQLNSAINDLSNLAPGLTDKYSEASLKGMLFKNPNAIANQIMLSEIGQITKGKEREYEARKTILAGQLDQLKTTVAGTPAHAALLADIEATMSGIREYGGINIPDGGVNPVGDVDDLLGGETGFAEAGPGFTETFQALFDKDKEEELVARSKTPDYKVGQFNKDLKDLEKLKGGKGLYAFGSETGKRKKEIDRAEGRIKKSLSNFYHPVDGFKNSKIEKAFKKRYKGKDYNDMIKYFDSLFESTEVTDKEKKEIRDEWMSTSGMGSRNPFIPTN